VKQFRIRSKTTLKTVAIAASLIVTSFAFGGTYSYNLSSATIGGSTSNVSCDISDGLSALLSVTANASQISTTGNATLTYNVTYTPDPGETGLPTTAYVTVGFANIFTQSSTSDQASALDLTDGVTVVDQIDPTYFSDLNGGYSPFGALLVPVTLTSGIGGVLTGSFTVASNSMKATVPTGSGETSSANQAVFIQDVNSTSPGSVPSRQRAATAPKASIIAVGGPSLSPNPWTYPSTGWPTNPALTKTGNYSVQTSGGFQFSEYFDMTATVNRADGDITAGWDNVTATQSFIVTMVQGTSGATLPTSYTVKYTGNRSSQLSASCSPGSPMSSGTAIAIASGLSLSANAGHPSPPDPSKPLPISGSFPVTLSVVDPHKSQGTFSKAITLGTAFVRVIFGAHGDVLHGKSLWNVHWYWSN